MLNLSRNIAQKVLARLRGCIFVVVDNTITEDDSK